MLYTETVLRLIQVRKEESIEVPEALVKLVKGNNKEFGRNGLLYMGCERQRQGGLVIDRLRHYIEHHNAYCVGYGHPCNCPVIL